MIKVIINGCNGKMGQVLSNEIKKESDIKIVAGIDKDTQKHSNTFPVFNNINNCLEKADVIIDFSNPACINNLLDYSIENKNALVIATTGFSTKSLEKIKDASMKIPIFYSSNMSLGINILISLAKQAASILKDSFDIEIIEKHHRMKIDSPSGTAYMIANKIDEELGNSTKFVFGRHTSNNKREKNEIGIHAIRGGTIVGEHTVIFAGPDEIIELKHTASSKVIFAKGAIKAAKYIVTKDKGLYSMDDLINLN